MKKKIKLAIKITLITISIIIAVPILLLAAIMCYHYGPAGILAVPIELKVLFGKSLNTYFFNQEIAPKIMEQMTDPNVRLELASVEEDMMPQFYINYSPNLEINFHTVIWSGKNTIIDKHPFFSVLVKNINTGKACSFIPRDENYDFLQAKPGTKSDKLLDIYHNRQTIIDDFVAEQPECFVE